MSPLWRGRTVQKEPAATDTTLMITLVCRACGGVLLFGGQGWEHRDSIRPCERVVVAWPPPDDRRDDEPAAATG
jgi:hypothetical protein